MLFVILIWAMFGLVCTLYFIKLDNIICKYGEIENKDNKGYKIINTIKNITYGPFLFIILFHLFRGNSSYKKQARKKMCENAINKYEVEKVMSGITIYRKVQNKPEVVERLEIALSQFPKFW